MPVLSESPSSGASSTYTFLGLAVLFTLVLALARRVKLKTKSRCASPSKSSPAARILSALPEKHYSPVSLSNTTSSNPLMHPRFSPVEQMERTDEQADSWEKESHSAPSQQQQHQGPQEVPAPPAATGTGEAKALRIVPRPPQLPLFKRGPGSNTPLLHPEPPSPSLTMVHGPGQGSILQPVSPQDGEQHQMIFVPSPTEYTSFEALYSQNPPYASSSFPDAPGAGPGAAGPGSAPFTSTAPAQSALPPRRRSYTKTLSNGSEMSGEVVVSSTAIEGQSWRRHTMVFGGGVCRACQESEKRMTA